MPFGMRNAPATFQRLVNLVVSDLPGCKAYLDDLVIYSASWTEHVKQVRPVDSKVEAVITFPAPKTRRELRRFLGMVGYYRSFCKNFSAVVSPLTDMLSTKTVFKWTEKCQRSFENVKALLVSTPVISAPDFTRPFKLAVDVSDCGAGAVLVQEDAHGIDHPVCYFSRMLNQHQRLYSTIEKEALVLALQHFDVHVGSSLRPVVVQTDHNPLVFLNRICNQNQRLMRWSLFLQAYDLDIRHIRGRDNAVADALSRTYECDNE
ncbi:hypothetical protein COCON_G00064110 [Conger conger]|uniref:ribonuclease H n=1 Tax=Conger conger TaxID=82655 RepID=A0A9Q1DRY0_CONCO|nr:hypothetical protein COCON_G00064110 [Conger conger]